MAVDNTSNDTDSTSVSVAVRIRPQSAKEKLAMSQICTSVASSAPQIFLGKDSSFTFDYVFSINSSQEEIFQSLARPLIDGCLNGFNATILAYGQTGSGKTYTMGTGFELNGTSQAGIIPRAVQYLFSRIAVCRSDAAAKNEPVPEFKVVAQFLELYNEELVDLLDSDRSRKSHLRLHENAQGDIYLTGVSTRLVSNLDDTLKCLRDGSLVRSTASTNMNAQSSRSHAIFTLHIRQQRLLKDDEDGNSTKSNDANASEQDPDSTVVDPVPEFETLTAKFHFVDLAGSERLKRTGATGDRAKEGISINRGLLALGNVISALGDKTKRGCHVPYRDSKLTRLLQDSLGGNSRTIMVACISPSDCDFVETLNTLKYANRARNIRNRVVMNQDKTSKQLATLRAQLAALQEELDEYRQGKRIPGGIGSDGVSDLSKEIALCRSENDRLHLRVKALTVTVDTLKARNARLLAEQEANAWSSLGRPQSTISEANMESSDDSTTQTKIEDGTRFRELVERYTIENEELRAKLAEAEALAEFGQRQFTFASPYHPSHLSGGGAINRVALTSNEFPNLDASFVTAAEAGLSVTNDFYLEPPDTELTSNSVLKSHHRSRRRLKRKPPKKEGETANGLNETCDSELQDSSKPNGESNGSQGGEESEDLEVIIVDGQCYTDGEEIRSGDADDLYVSNEEGETLNETLLADCTTRNGTSEKTKNDHRSTSRNGTLSDASEVHSSESDESDDQSGSAYEDEDEAKTMKNREACAANEAKLHRSLAHVSSEIDSKQRLLAELQSKASQLEQLRRHYESKFNHLQTRIRETERERDSVLANLGQVEHTGEERLRRTREEFEKKLSSLQDEVKQLQQTRQAQARMEREQAKKNGELRQLRTELEELRRYKVELTKRLQQEAKRARLLEMMSAKRVMQLKRADNQIRTLEAAHCAKERALKQKQAEVEALKRKTLEQQRQLSSSINRMTQSAIASSGSNYGPPARSTQRVVNRNVASRNSFADNLPTTALTLRGRLAVNAKAKWTLVNQQLEIDVQRRQTSTRLERDLQTWVRERDGLSRRLQRLQRRRARLEELGMDDADQNVLTSRLASFDEQIRNITAQLDSAQEAIRDCQSSIIELDKATPKTVSIGARSKVSMIPAFNATALFSNCTLSEARYLLTQLYEHAVTRGLQVNRLQQSDAQLRANISVWEQEREQELEVLRLTMQHAGLPMDSVDNVLSVTTATDRLIKSTSACPHHQGMSAAAALGCECCSQTGVPSSAPLSSEDSSAGEEEEGNISSLGPVNSRTAGKLPTSMSRSMYASLDSANGHRPGGRNLSETEDHVSDKSDARSMKARVRMLLPQDMLGFCNPDSSNPSDLMPPPAGTCLLRRPRTATGQPTAMTTPLSAGPSPSVRRRIPGQVSSTSSSVPPTITAHNPPVCMSSSVNLPPGSVTSDSQTVQSSTDAARQSMLSNPGGDEDVFNRLTSGMFNSPHPARGSIQPLVKTGDSPTAAAPGSATSLLHAPGHSFRLATSTGPTPTMCSSSTMPSTTSSATQQPLAAFFNSTSGQPAASSVTASNNQPASFRVPMECTHVARGHSNSVLDVDVVGNVMITGSKDRTAKLWDLETMEEIDTLRDHPNNVSKVRMCPDTGLVFTVCSYFIKVWDRRDPRKCIRTLLSSGLSQDGELEMKITRRQNICPPGETNIMDVALGGPHSSSQHSMFLATANSVKLWDLRRYYSIGKLHGNHQAPVMVLAAGPTCAPSTDPSLTVVTGSKDHYIKVFNVGPNASGLLTPSFELEPPHYDGIESLVLHGSTLFSGSRDAAIKKWNLARDGRQEVMLAQAHKDWIQGLAVTGDGLHLISVCRGGHLKLWNVDDCTCLGEVLNAHDSSINAVRAYGDRIFTAGSDKDVRFWRLLEHPTR